MAIESVAIAVGHPNRRLALIAPTQTIGPGDRMVECNTPTIESCELETTILERIATGEQAAVDDCLDLYGGLIWSLARKMCSNTADAEDATQEIFTEIWQRAATFDKSLSSEKTFICMIARRRLIDRLRRSQHSPKFVADDIRDLDLTATAVGDHAELRDESSKVSQCMEKLNNEQRNIIVLSVHHGVSHSNIAQKMLMPLGTVKSYARRALLQLRECMQRPVLSSVGRAD